MVGLKVMVIYVRIYIRKNKIKTVFIVLIK